jgi:hypothetical protein
MLDCADQGLNKIPMPRAVRKHGLVMVLDLRRNNISSVHESTVLKIYPRLAYLDLRDNPIDCSDIKFSKIKVKSDCKTTTYIYLNPSSERSITKSMLASQNYSKTKSVNLNLVSMANSTAKCCKTENGFQSTRSVSSAVKLGMNTWVSENGKTKIILLSTLIPVVVLLIVSIGIYGLRSPRCHRRTINEHVITDLNMEQIGSTGTLDTDLGSSVEIYSTQTTEM